MCILAFGEREREKGKREREKERGKEREGKKWRAQIIDSLGNDSAMRFLSRKVSHSRKNEKN